MLTTQEVDQYIRLTLKQWDLAHVSVKWFSSSRTLGRADVWKNVLELNLGILKRFSLFEEVLKHEIAHFLQYRENGNTFFRKKNRWQIHGADFKAQCRRLKIPARSRIPADQSCRV